MSSTRYGSISSRRRSRTSHPGRPGAGAPFKLRPQGDEEALYMLPDDPPAALDILVVDDDPGELVLLRRHLQRARLPHRVTACHDPGRVKAVLAERPFDLVLLDHNLGCTTGIDVLRQLQGDPDHPPVVMLTGHGDELTAVAALQAGARDYLPKDRLDAGSLTRTIVLATKTHQLERIVAQQRVDLERANGELSRKNRELEGFYHTVSHELKTPLTSALEFVSLVVEGHAGSTTPEQRDFLGIALESCRQMTHYINDMLDVTRLETGKMSIAKSVSELGPFLIRTVEALMLQAAEEGIALQLALGSHLPPALIDERRIAQVLRNLIGNALKFTPEGGRIDVEACVADEPGKLLVVVSDTGRGIPADKIGLVFDRLVQVEVDDYATHGGLGLGLSICRDLIQLHGGRIWVESEVGRGTRFSFTLPAAAALALTP